MVAELLSCDERGRLLLPQDVRKSYGRMFHLARARGELILIPASKDPLSELAELGKKAGIARRSIKSLKQEIRKQAQKELHS